VHDLFILEKSTPGTWREICNAKELNDRYTVKHPSYIGGVHEARDIVRPGDILTAVDIRDAYPGVAIDPYFRNLFLLRHIFAGDTEPTWLRYSTMPFGAHDSARAYTRVLKPVCAYLRSKGLRIAKLLDDILLACSTPEQSLSHTQLLVDTLTRLHFTLARAKAEVVGEHRREFLGLVWDTLCMTTRLPPKRLLKIKTAATVTLAMLRAGTLTLRALAGMVGQAAAARDAVAVVPLMHREAQRWLNAALAVQVRELGLFSHERLLADELDSAAFVPEELWDFQAIRASAHAGNAKQSVDHWSRKVRWDTRVLKSLPHIFVERRQPLLTAELEWWRDELPQWNGKWIHPHNAPAPRYEY